MRAGASCYTIWFSQRTGSTWLCDALGATGIAGRPGELLHAAEPERLCEHYDAPSAAALVAALRRLGSTPNGVFGIKQGFSEPHFGQVIALLVEGTASGGTSRLAVWEHAFPNHRHVFMTRRNKVRLAVSWWRAIQTGEWHRRQGETQRQEDLEDRYDFHAIDHLLSECVLREAGIQELLAEGGVAPLTVAYEDLVANPPAELRRMLAFLGLDGGPGVGFRSGLVRIADPVSEAWVQRFREEKQRGWRNLAW